MLSTVFTCGFFCSAQIYEFRPTFSRLYDNRTGTYLKDAIYKLRQYRTSEQQNYKAITVTLPDIDTERMNEEKTLLYTLIMF